MSNPRPSVQAAVTFQKERIQGPMARWQPFRWVLAAVALHDETMGTEPRLLYQDDGEERWLYGGLTVELFQDDAEGYYLNASTAAPCWFVLWRLIDERAVPVAVSLSYHDAGRWLDAQEYVDQVPAQPEVVAWLQAYIDVHHVVEVKRRQRPESFKPLTDRFGNPASVSTDKAKRGGHGGG
jgi:Protein of unknown function (DUF3305)